MTWAKLIHFARVTHMNSFKLALCYFNINIIKGSPLNQFHLFLYRVSHCDCNSVMKTLSALQWHARITYCMFVPPDTRNNPVPSSVRHTEKGRTRKQEEGMRCDQSQLWDFLTYSWGRPQEALCIHHPNCPSSARPTALVSTLKH